MAGEPKEKRCAIRGVRFLNDGLWFAQRVLPQETLDPKGKELVIFASMRTMEPNVSTLSWNPLLQGTKLDIYRVHLVQEDASKMWAAAPIIQYLPVQSWSLEGLFRLQATFLCTHNRRCSGEGALFAWWRDKKCKSTLQINMEPGIGASLQQLLQS